jgi:hypothetical protein
VLELETDRKAVLLPDTDCFLAGEGVVSSLLRGLHNNEKLLVYSILAADPELARHSWAYFKTASLQQNFGFSCIRAVHIPRIVDGLIHEDELKRLMLGKMRRDLRIAVSEFVSLGVVDLQQRWLGTNRDDEMFSVRYVLNSVSQKRVALTAIEESFQSLRRPLAVEDVQRLCFDSFRDLPHNLKKILINGKPYVATVSSRIQQNHLGSLWQTA